MFTVTITAGKPIPTGSVLQTRKPQPTSPAIRVSRPLIRLDAHRSTHQNSSSQKWPARFLTDLHH
jgi:hypothetical protein